MTAAAHYNDKHWTKQANIGREKCVAPVPTYVAVRVIFNRFS